MYVYRSRSVDGYSTVHLSLLVCGCCRNTNSVEKEAPEPELGWSVVCTTVEEWEGLIESLKEYKTGPEKHLCRILEQNFLPEIVEIIAQRVRFCV